MPVVEFRRGPSPLDLTVQRLEEPGPCPPGPHRHDHFVLLFVESGGGRHSAHGHHVDAGRGTLIALAPGIAHDWSPLDSAGWHVAFSPAALDSALTEQPVHARMPLPGDARWLAFVRRPGSPWAGTTVPAAACPQWTQRLEALAKELSEQPVGYAPAARAHLAMLLVETGRLTRPADEDEFLEPVDPILADVLGVIEDRYHEHLSLAEIARAVARTAGHLSRVVKQLTGSTVMHHLEQRRMCEARRLLLATDLTVDSIAVRTGYPDPGYFRRRFRSEHGAPPQVWRQLNR